MAHLNFIKASIVGRLGEVVGSRWKGVNYIKTYTKPTNPQTADQQLNRNLFGFIGRMASAYSESILNGFMFPSPRRMSRMNRCLQINKAMIANGSIIIPQLQIYPASKYADLPLYVQSANGEIIGGMFVMTVELSELSTLPLLPDAIAIGGYNGNEDLWYGMGVFPFSTGLLYTNDLWTITFEVPGTVWFEPNSFCVFCAPVWYPNKKLGVTGGNGPTNSYYEGKVSSPYVPSVLHTASAGMTSQLRDIEQSLANARKLKPMSGEEKEKRYEEIVKKRGIPGIVMRITPFEQEVAILEKRKLKAIARQEAKNALADSHTIAESHKGNQKNTAT